MLQDMIFADQRVEKSTHAKNLTYFELGVDEMVLELNCHVLLIFMQYAVIEGAF